MQETADKNATKDAPNRAEIETLVQELLKDNPNEETVKKLMTDLKVEFTDDPIQRIINVLHYLHQNDMNGAEFNVI